MVETVLIVDDERALVEGLSYTLGKEGYRVLHAPNGPSALELTFKERPNVVLLDVMLPGLDGLSVCRELRARGFLGPILMLTSKVEEVDRVVGLEVGADDYVTKPFSSKELVARIRAHLRREQRQQPSDPTELRSEDLHLQLESRQVQRGGKPVELTPREFDLLAYFMNNAGRALSRDTLLEQVWGYDFEGESNIVNVTVGRLRDKIERDPSRPRFLLTVRGVGYRFAPSVLSC